MRFFCIVLSCLAATHGHYTNEYAVEVLDADPNQVAAESGCVNDGLIIGNTYQFTCHAIRKRSIHSEHHTGLNNHGSVKHVEQQKVLSRKKRQLFRLNTPAPPQLHFEDLLHLNDNRY